MAGPDATSDCETVKPGSMLRVGQTRWMALVGLEPTPEPSTNPSGKPRISPVGGAEMGAGVGFAAQCDRRREKIIALLPTLPEAVIDAILRLAEQGKPSGPSRG